MNEELQAHIEVQARLIRAAPALYEACKCFMRCSEGHGLWDELNRKMREAIAQVEGEEP